MTDEEEALALPRGCVLARARLRVSSKYGRDQPVTPNIRRGPERRAWLVSHSRARRWLHRSRPVTDAMGRLRGNARGTNDVAPILPRAQPGPDTHEWSHTPTQLTKSRFGAV